MNRSRQPLDSRIPIVVTLKNDALSTIPRGQRRGEKRPLSVWRWSLILTRFQTVRCFSQIYFPENMFKFGNSHLYTYITPNISWGVVFPFWRSSPVMGNPPIHWKPKMNIALMMRSFAKTIIDKHINVYHCYISATIFVFPILPIIYDYIGIIWSQFLPYCTFSLKKELKSYI